MADKIKFVCEDPATLLYSSITQASAPRNVANAEPKFSGTFGLTDKDFKAMIPFMVQCIQAETGGFSGNPNDYYLACTSGNTAAERVLLKAKLDAQVETGKGNNDKAFSIMEKAEKRAAAYRNYGGILSAASKFPIELAKLENGAIKDILTEAAIAQAGKDCFYSGAIVVPSIALQGFRRKKLDDRDGVTAFLQNVLFLRKGPKLDLGGGGPSNSEVFGGFKNYSDYDPLANAPGGNDAWSGGGSQAGQVGNGAGTAGNPSPDPSASHSNAPSTTTFPSNGQQNGGGYQPQGGFDNSQTPAAAPQW